MENGRAKLLRKSKGNTVQIPNRFMENLLEKQNLLKTKKIYGI